MKVLDLSKLPPGARFSIVELHNPYSYDFTVLETGCVGNRIIVQERTTFSGKLISQDVGYCYPRVTRGELFRIYPNMQTNNSMFVIRVGEIKIDHTES